MQSLSPILHPDRPGASRNIIPAMSLTVFEADDSTSRDTFGNNCKVLIPCRLGNAEDLSTLTERVLTFLDRHAA